MASPEHMLCYGKRLFAKRIGLAGISPRRPCVQPSDFGEETVARYSSVLPRLLQ
jgi:4-hydroxy-tetrahydrodipicolinate synthase